MRGGAAAAAAIAAAVTAPSLLDPPGALAAPLGDAAVLVSLLRVEQVLVAAYERALATGILSAAAQSLVRSFLDQERAHVHALSGAVPRGAGASLPDSPQTTSAFDAELRALRIRRSPTELRNERPYLRFLVELEVVIAHHYRFAIASLEGEKPLLTAAEIMANEAQHATSLRELLSPGNVKRAVPSAFVAGTT